MKGVIMKKLLASSLYTFAAMFLILFYNYLTIEYPKIGGLVFIIVGILFIVTGLVSVGCMVYFMLKEKSNKIS